MEAGTQAAIREALDQLWVKFLPQMEERLGVLQVANRALAEGSLSLEQRSDAVSAAHKLAGVLGTFGLGAGTELAREAEVLCSRDLSAEPEARKKLDTITMQLSELVGTRRV